MGRPALRSKHASSTRTRGGNPRGGGGADSLGNHRRSRWFDVCISPEREPGGGWGTSPAPPPTTSRRDPASFFFFFPFKFSLRQKFGKANLHKAACQRGHGAARGGPATPGKPPTAQISL